MVVGEADRVGPGSLSSPTLPFQGRDQAIAFFRFSSTLSRKPVVESHFWLGPISEARSLVMKRQSAAIAAFSVALGRIAADALAESGT
jgi:hypothetical protein